MVHGPVPKFDKAATSSAFQDKPVKKPAFPAPAPKEQQGAKPKNNGAWGPVFKNKQNFKDMHMF